MRPAERSAARCSLGPLRRAGITLLPWTLLTDLLTTDGRVSGARLLDENGEIRTVQARAVLLASGGAGQVYSDTTNPAVATGDGIAAAHAAGAELADMEFYQFHPTALSLPGVPRFLLSEALRGEGARLVNAAGDRFMQRYHALLELAPARRGGARDHARRHGRKARVPGHAARHRYQS